MSSKIQQPDLLKHLASTGNKKSDRQLAAILCDPRMYVEAVLGHRTWNIQAEILAAVANNPRVAVKACHASSKTFTAAELVLWWITRYPDGIAITTAPKFEQVEKLLWMELHKAIQGSIFKYPKPNLTELKLKPGNYAVGWSTKEGINFQGIHGPHVLIVIDEAPGVDADIWEAIEGARAGGDVHILALGNPTIAGGPFYDAFTENRSGWKVITIDAFATPNLKGFSLELLRSLPPDLPANHPLFAFQPLPFLINRRWVYERYWEWTEESPLWQARVLGQFPRQSEDALISLSWLEASRAPAQDTGDQVIAGIDVAGPGADETVVTIRCRDSILCQWFSSSDDPRGDVIAMLNPWRPRLQSVNVDSIGIGYNFSLHLRDQGFPVRRINVGNSAFDSERFANLKAEHYWKLREHFQAGQIKGINDERTLSQLAVLRYRHNSRGRVEIESKEEMQRRGVKSPDRADSLMLAFARDQSDPVESAMRYTREIAQWRQAAEEARAQGKPPPPHPYDGKSVMDAYTKSAAEFRKLLGV